MSSRVPLAALSSLVLVVGACSSQSPSQPTAMTPSSAAPALGASGAVHSTNHSEQVVFSGEAAQGSTFPSGSPVQFWVWCEADSTNPYQGECNGAMTFDALRLTRHVEGEVTEPSDGVYVATVSSTLDNQIVSCTLTNGTPVNHGPTNTVTVSCQTPSGSATSTSAVVNVTGPEH